MKQAHTKPWNCERIWPLQGAASTLGWQLCKTMKNVQEESWHTSWKRWCINNKESVKAELLNSYLASLFSTKGNDIYKQKQKKQSHLSHHWGLKLKGSMVVGKEIMHICYFKWVKLLMSSQNVSGNGWTQRARHQNSPSTSNDYIKCDEPPSWHILKRIT